MSSNKGKDGELKTAIVIANIGLCKDGVDFTRPTTTNTADQGADLFMTHPKGFLEEIADVTQSEIVSEPKKNTNKSQKSEKSRIDVKTTERKLQKDTVLKFIGDCNNHPTCEGQILLGGTDLTGPAKKEFKAAQERQAKKGKTLLYIKNDGVKKLEQHYKPNEIDEKRNDNKID